MKPLIDGDILRYEIGYCGQLKDEVTGELKYMSFEFVSDLLDARIEHICEEVEATVPPTIYLTEDTLINNHLNRSRKREGLEPLKVDPNFREEIAITKPYKGTRKTDKPFHFENLTAYILSKYDCNIAKKMEADDIMCIHQVGSTKYNLINTHGIGGRSDTIICSRDKDLRMCPGWHYSWECGKQPSHGPVHVDFETVGWLEKKDDGKVIGYGDKFFFYQLLTGDVVDNIPGCKGAGAVKAFNLLDPLESKEQCYNAVVQLYQKVYPDTWKTYIREQANLLWMVRELNEDGSPVLFNPKDFLGCD